MKIKNLLLLAIFPAALMAYGWYLGQLHQSMQDLAGILLFITGSIALALALVAYRILGRFAWRETWWGSLAISFGSCVLVFFGTWLYAVLHG